MVEPKNISVVEDEDKVWVKFALPGFMESCQMYRKMGHCTDVKVHCFHVNSEDVTIYSAHNLLLSAASTYFSFVLIQAFTQLTDLRTNNLKKVLRIIKNDDSYIDKSLNTEENIIKFGVPLCHDKPPCCSQKHGSRTFTNVDSPYNKINSCEVEISEREILNVTIKSFNSANNIIMAIKGIDPIYIKYVLKCIYSESFCIERKHIELFLSFIFQIKLTNFSTLTTLLRPFIARSNSQIRQNPTPAVDLCVNCQLNSNSSSALKFYEHKEEYTVLNSLYDIYQWSSTNEIRPAGMSSAPLDLSCKSVVNNNTSENHEHFYPDTEELTNRKYCNTFDYSALKIQNNVRHNSGFGNLNPYLWFFNSGEALPTSSQGMTNISNIASANSCYNSGSNIYFQEANGRDSFWREYHAANYQKDLRAYIPDLNRYATLLNMKNLKNEPGPNYGNEYKHPNVNCEAGSNNDEPKINLYNDRKKTPILEKLERISSIEVKRLDAPIDSESSFKNKSCFKRKSEQGYNSNIKLTGKNVKTDSRNVIQATCSAFGDNFIANSENRESVNAASVSTMNEDFLLKTCDEKLVLDPSPDSFEANSLKCFICEYSSYSINEVIFHMRSSHFSRNLRIAKCVDQNCPVQLLFTSKEWETHIQHHFIKYTYQCASCTYSTKTKKGILRHEMTHKSTYKRLQKAKKATSAKSSLGRKCTHKYVRKSTKKARIEQFPETKTLSEIQSSNVFGTPTFKKFQRGLKKRRNNCDVLQKIHFQIAKVTKGKLKVKSQKNRTRSKKLSDSQVSCELNEETVNADRESYLSSISEEKPANECQEFGGSSVKGNVFQHSLNRISNFSSCDPSSNQKIKTKTVRVLNKKKLKFINCTLCNTVLPSEEEMTLHYYTSHNLILPFKCPYHDCQVYLDNTSLLYSHINIHAEKDRSILQADASSIFSLNETNLK